MYKLWVVAALLLLTACTQSGGSLRQKAAAQAASVGMKEVEIPTSNFTFLTFERIRDPKAPVRVYIEGDGNAWLTRSQVSPDPTPLDPTALNLAVRDSAPNVAYLARPCQYVTSPACAPKYWTSAQFSEPVITSVNEALNHWQGHKIELVGYSGGAAVVMLTAARRTDVISIRTVAGNIDTQTFTDIHHVSPLSESMNPASFALHTALVPQLHFVGDKDLVVPRPIAEAYQGRLPAVNCSAINVVNGVDHYSGWQDQWPILLQWHLPCNGSFTQ